MYDIGRVVIKLAGRDAGKKAAIVEKLDDRYVMIDGETRRRKCNVAHLEVLNETINIKEKASHEEVCKALKIPILKKNPKKAKERPKKVRKVKEKPVKKSKEDKSKEVKKERKDTSASASKEPLASPSDANKETKNASQGNSQGKTAQPEKTSTEKVTETKQKG